jgi:molecular chaperone GrpE
VINGKHRTRPGDDDVVFLDDSAGDDMARAVEEAVRAVTAVEARHRPAGSEPVFPHPPPVEPDEPVARAPGGGSDVPEAEPSAEEDRCAALLSAIEAERERAAKAEDEVRQLREVLLRKTADLENVKRRTEKEKADHFRFALSEVIRELLAVVDNFERALEHAPEGIRGGDFAVGVEMTGKQLSDVLRRFGVTEIVADHLPFDPNVHEAVAREETPAVPPGVVLEVFQKGYVLNGRLLRPAMVKVSALPVRARMEGEV